MRPPASAVKFDFLGRSFVLYQVPMLSYIENLGKCKEHTALATVSFWFAHCSGAQTSQRGAGAHGAGSHGEPGMFMNLMLAVLVAFPEMPAVNKEVAAAVEKVLALKGKTFPFDAEYELDLPLQPRVAAGKVRRRFIACEPNALYSEELRDTFATRVLIRAGEFYWEYWEPGEGSSLFFGPIKLGKDSPESWLQKHSYVHNTYGDLDADLMSIVDELLKDSKVLEHSSKDGRTRLVLSSKSHGRVTVTVTGKSLEVVSLPADEAGKARILLRYAYRESVPEKSADPQPALLAKFSNAKKDEIRRLEGDVSMPAVLEKVFGHLRQNRKISTEEARGLAQRYGYLLPKEESRIREATTYYRQLALVIEFEKKVYTVVQFRMEDQSRPLVKRFARRTRKYQDYTVFEVIDPGTKAKSVYYVKDNLALTLGDPVDFEDKALDELVSSFQAVQRPK